MNTNDIGATTLTTRRRLKLVPFRGQALAQAWLTAAATVFEAATLVADAGGLILDGVFNIPAQDVAGFTVEAMRAEAAALIAPVPPVGG